MLISRNCDDVAKPNVEMYFFPDGECYVRPEVLDRTVLHRTYPDTNASLVQLFQMLDVAGEKYSELTCIIPYLAYSRQERRVKENEAISARTILKILNSLKVKEIVTFDCHFLKGRETATVEGVKIRNVLLAERLIDKARKKFPGESLVIAPDKGAYYMGAQTYFEKTRGEYVREANTTYRAVNHLNTVNVEKLLRDNSFDNAILIDDIIASGGTMLEAVKLCRGLGFKRIIVACVHAQFLDNSDKKLQEYADFIITSNTIKNPYTQVYFQHYLPKEFTL